ncbi:MAG: trimethylamine methyltransferase family protein [Desulfosarcinaceae bacterium]|nr:trimethylamine methyltransferase family protein [Desulfosarcinaceae bacterium]
MSAETIEHNLEQLHQASMRLIENTGVRLHHPEMLGLVASNGIRVADGRVYFTRDQLNAWIAHAPAEFTIYARNSEHDMRIGGDRVEHVSSNAGFPFIADLAGNRRKARFDDYLTFVKLVHATPAFNMNGGVMVTPDDLPNDVNLYPTLLYATLVHSDKCLFGGMGGREESRNTMQMLMALFATDKEGLVKAPRIANLVSTLSPLQFDEKMLDTLMVYADHGQPVVVSPAVMAGSTGPVTLAGTIAISNAETLVGVALAQMVRRGTPAIYGSATANADMRTGAFTIGTPESALAVKYCARLAKMYGLPCRGGGGLNDAKNVSVQAGYESMMVQFVANQEKINFNFHSAGGLDSYGAMSFEKYIVDLEILERVNHYLADLNTDETHMALDVIEQVGPGGEFLTQMHTALHCRTAPFATKVSLQGALPAGQTADEALFGKIAQALERLLNRYQRPDLPADGKSRLDACMQDLGIDVAGLGRRMHPHPAEA